MQNSKLTEEIFQRYGVNQENLGKIVENAKNFAMLKGVLMRPKDVSMDTRVPLPFCLLPSPFPRIWFETVKELQTALNYVLHCISFSREILKECLSGTIEVDDFTRNIYKIFDATYNEERLSLGLIRSDYLLNLDSSGNIDGIKQVENNTFSTSFQGIAPMIREVHRFVLDRSGHRDFDELLPENESCVLMAQGLIGAWDAYAQSSAAILFVVREQETNLGDQYALEFAILEDEKDIQILRCSFQDLRTSATIVENKLYVNDREIAVVYYRTGYVPEDYEPEDWEVRLLMERSCAIKCPSTGLHLAGTKKMQYFLNQPGFLEKFVDRNIARNLRQVFASIHILNEGPDGDNAIQVAMENPHIYILKPEREGGGNNYYDDEVKTVLEKIKDSEERKGYILMERIKPPTYANCIVLRDTVPSISNVVSELGIYGTILGNKEDIFTNRFAGHILRSKPADSNETGVAAGFGALDSPYFE